MIFQVTDLLKQSRLGTHLQDLVLVRYSFCRRLCIVTLLNEYLARTKDIRGTHPGLLLSYVQPHGPVTKATIGRWLKTVLAQCGIHKNYGAHSTRGAASSKAAFVHVPIDTIMKAAGWSSLSTFAKHYNKPITQLGHFAHAILDAAVK